MNTIGCSPIGRNRLSSANSREFTDAKAKSTTCCAEKSSPSEGSQPGGLFGRLRSHLFECARAGHQKPDAEQNHGDLQGSKHPPIDAVDSVLHRRNAVQSQRPHEPSSARARRHHAIRKTLAVHARKKSASASRRRVLFSDNGSAVRLHVFVRPTTAREIRQP